MQRPKPNYGKQKSASRPISVARALPKLSLTRSAAPVSAARPKPQVGKPGPGGNVKGGRNG
ncbi:MAG: hypothetical protein ACJ74H_17685 [Thermoanaerobaculia bacterium]